MPVLELAMDNTGLLRGQQQAEAALRGVQVAADKTQQSVTSIGGGIRNTFQAVQGVSQVGQGINSVARSFGDLNIAMGTFAASRTLLEIGKTADDFRQMAGTVTTTTTNMLGITTTTTRAASAFQVLRAAMLAHPILTVATALGAAASIMALFSGSTKSAAASFDELATSMNKVHLDERVARLLGLPVGVKSELSGIQQGIGSVLDRVQKGDKTFTVGEIGPAGGIGEADLLRYLRLKGNKEADEYIRTGQIIKETAHGRFDRTIYKDRGDVELDSRQALDYLIGQYKWFAGRRPEEAPSGVPQPVVGLSHKYDVVPPGSYDMQDPYNLGIRPYGATGTGDYVSISPMQQSQVDAENRAAYYEKINQAMERAAGYAAQIGSSLGGAVYDVLAGIQGWRQALASIIQSFAKQGLSELGSSLAVNAFNSTLRQQTPTAPLVNPQNYVMAPGSGTG